MTQFVTGHDAETVPDELGQDVLDDVSAAIAHARVTGSVACTYNEVRAERLYRLEAGERVATDHWLITVPDPA